MQAILKLRDRVLEWMIEKWGIWSDEDGDGEDEIVNIRIPIHVLMLGGIAGTMFLLYLLLILQDFLKGIYE